MWPRALLGLSTLKRLTEYAPGRGNGGIHVKAWEQASTQGWEQQRVEEEWRKRKGAYLDCGGGDVDVSGRLSPELGSS